MIHTPDTDDVRRMLAQCVDPLRGRLLKLEGDVEYLLEMVAEIRNDKPAKSATAPTDIDAVLKLARGIKIHERMARGASQKAWARKAYVLAEALIRFAPVYVAACNWADVENSIGRPNAPHVGASVLLDAIATARKESP